MNEGRTRLRAWMERSRLTQRKAAEMLGMHYTFLSQILNDLRTPALATAIRIERITGIPVEAWMPTEVDLASVCLSTKPRNAKRGKS